MPHCAAMKPCRVFVLSFAALLVACASGPSSVDLSVAGNAWVRAGASVSDQAMPWQHQAFPGKRKNQYQYVWREGRPAMAVASEGSISAVRQVVMRPEQSLGQIRFSWKVASVIADADLQQGAKEDSPVRLVLVFDGDRSQLSARDAMLSELARAVTGEELPYATLMYVWSNQLPVDTVVNNRRTDRIRKLVIQSGLGPVNHWLDYERDIRADYERVFGEPPGPLRAVAIMTDTDNTGGSVRAWYGPVQFLSRP